MKLFDLFSESEFRQQLADGMVKVTAHPTEDLQILNYTPKAQFTPELWNHVTDVCRGLIYNAETMELKARPFVKFWNYSDSRHSETMPENLPPVDPVITRKMDGSLGIGYWTKEGFSIATRGSFASDQAVWATTWARNNLLADFPPGYTPLFEIIYPENQIVVKYNYEGLVLLAMINIETGEEVDRQELCHTAAMTGVGLVEAFDGKSVLDCSSEDAENEEGYVASWTRDGTFPLRVKIKYATYARLHKLLTQTNAVTVWEMLRDGQDLKDLTKDVPHDFMLWLASVESRLLGEFKALEDRALSAMFAYEGTKTITNPEERKHFALYAVQQQPVTPILFAMLDGKQYAPIIWKTIRPRGDEKTFKVDIDL